LGIFFWLSVVSYRLSVIGYQLSVISYRLSVIGCRLFVVGSLFKIRCSLFQCSILDIEFYHEVCIKLLKSHIVPRKSLNLISHIRKYKKVASLNLS
jgi:hypothetical protein